MSLVIISGRMCSVANNREFPCSRLTPKWGCFSLHNQQVQLSGGLQAWPSQGASSLWVSQFRPLNVGFVFRLLFLCLQDGSIQQPCLLTPCSCPPPTSRLKSCDWWDPGWRKMWASCSKLIENFTKERCPFNYRGLECKSRKSRNTWSNRHIWLWSTEWSRTKANRVLSKEHTGHSKHTLPTTQEKTLHMDITRWSTLKSIGLYSLQPKMEKLYTISKNKARSWLWLRSWSPYCQIQP